MREGKGKKKKGEREKKRTLAHEETNGTSLRRNRELRMLIFVVVAQGPCHQKNAEAREKER